MDKYQILPILLKMIFSTNAASNITSGISVSIGNRSNPTTSTSTLTTFSAQIQPNHYQINQYNRNSTYQNLLEEAQQIYKIQITDSTRHQYLSTNITYVIFIFKKYHSSILSLKIDQYEE